MGTVTLCPLADACQPPDICHLCDAALIGKGQMKDDHFHILEEIERIAGRDAADKVARECGGRRIKLPAASRLDSSPSDRKPTSTPPTMPPPAKP
ncbi:MAG: hypothetical protein J0I67_10290 [Bosea sp.]|nr:hypothetical protein [Bosea sp. (in: a-proteobacteria)]